MNVAVGCMVPLSEVVKQANDDCVTYDEIVNRECEKFKLEGLSTDQFKCLIFVSGLQSLSEAPIRMKLLSLIESKKEQIFPSSSMNAKGFRNSLRTQSW